MLKNHKYLSFSKFSDSNDDLVFLKAQKPCFGVIFELFQAFLPKCEF